MPGCDTLFINMERRTYRLYANTLWLLLGLFVYRVVAQLAVYFIDVPFLPDFNHWHSAKMPYAVLVFFQLVIILIFMRIAMTFTRRNVVPRYRVGLSLLPVGGVYFSLMFSRLIIGAFSLSDNPWWNKPIPSFFHLVLASFLIVVGYFHWRYGKKQA